MTPNIAFLDTETGGLNPHTDALLEIGLHLPHAPHLDLSSVILPDPDLNITDGAKRVNGWPKAYEGRAKITEPEAILLLQRRLKEENVRVLVCHNAPFDTAFIKSAAHRARKLLEEQPEPKPFSLPRTLCTMSMGAAMNAMGAFSEDKQIPSLDFLLKELCPGFRRPRPHTALDDAKATAEVYQAMLLALKGASAILNTFNHNPINEPKQQETQQNNNQNPQNQKPSFHSRGWNRIGQ